jgi:hypothetical protein
MHFKNMYIAAGAAEDSINYTQGCKDTPPSVIAGATSKSLLFPSALPRLKASGIYVL